jgi:CRP/FNR family cyclic AMP-dependent transcriptional regulator
MPKSDGALERLAEVPLFSALSERELQEVDRASDEIEVEPGREVVIQGRIGHEFFLILSGTAKVVRDGEEVTTLGPGQGFGELALLDQGPRTATVVAETPMELVVLGQREFAGLLETVPGLATHLLTGVAKRLRAAESGPIVD